MKRYVLILIAGFIVGGSFLLESCRKKDYVPAPTTVEFVVPSGWPAPEYDFTQNPLTVEGIELGRHLFYEGKLSKNGNISCATCHEQVSGFTHEDHSFGHGYGGDTYRNPPGIYNMAWYKEFLQDGSKKKLEDVYIDHINSPIDMGETVENVITKLKIDAKYRSMFRAAFGDPEINAERMTRALSQFVLTIVSNNSKYDKVERGEATFSLAEQLGYDIFKTKCGTCHKEPLLTDMSYRNIGLTVDPDRNDFGRMRVTNNSNDSLKFRVLSLRNAQLTRPFAHDGRFFSYTNMYMHYNAGVVNSSTTDPLLVGGIPLSNFEQGQLTAFLNSLTDSVMINNPGFKKPN